MSVREYIGARYVPEFGRHGETSIAWDNDAPYEPLTIVQYQGNSYTSRQYVPAGIGAPNNNPNYWALTGNYNAQIEAYRHEVQQFADEIAEAKDTADDALDAVNQETEDRQAADTEVLQGATDLVNAETAARESAVSAETAARESAVSAETAARVSADNRLSNQIETLEQQVPKVRTQYGQHMLCIGDSYGRGSGGTIGEGWPYHLSMALKCASYFNVSNGQAGYTQPGTTGDLAGMNFLQMIEYAASHLPSGRVAEDYTLLIIGGGYNDASRLSDTDGIWPAVNGTINRAHTLFPNAKVYVACLCNGQRAMTDWRHRVYGLIMYGAARTGAAVLGNAPYYLYPWATSTNGDGTHPNATGYSYLGGFMAADIAGGTWLPQTTSDNSQGFALSTGVTNTSFVSRVQQGTAFFGGEINFTYRTGSSLYTDLMTLPYFMRPSATRYFLVFLYANSDDQGWVRAYVNTSGTLGLQGFDLGSTVLWGDNTKYRVFIPTQMVPLGNSW